MSTVPDHSLPSYPILSKIPSPYNGLDRPGPGPQRLLVLLPISHVGPSLHLHEPLAAPALSLAEPCLLLLHLMCPMCTATAETSAWLVPNCTHASSSITPQRSSLTLFSQKQSPLWSGAPPQLSLSSQADLLTDTRLCKCASAVLPSWTAGSRKQGLPSIYHCALQVQNSAWHSADAQKSPAV